MNTTSAHIATNNARPYHPNDDRVPARLHNHQHIADSAVTITGSVPPPQRPRSIRQQRAAGSSPVAGNRSTRRNILLPVPLDVHLEVRQRPTERMGVRHLPVIAGGRPALRLEASS